MRVRKPHSSIRPRTLPRPLACTRTVSSARKLLPPSRTHHARCTGTGLGSSHICAVAHPCHIFAGAGPTPCPHLHRDWAHPCHICTGTGRSSAHICAGTGLTPAHICTGTGLTPATSAPGQGAARPTSAPGLGSPLPHLHRDWAQLCHICAGTGLSSATSAPGLGSPLPHCTGTARACLCPAARSASPEIPSSHSSSLHAGSAHLPTRSGNPRPSVLPTSSGIPVGDQGVSAGTSRLCGSSARGDIEAMVSEPGGPGSFGWSSELPSHFDAKDAP
jgi:hypothetical protein